MNLLKKLFGQGRNQPEVPQWNPTPPEQRPAPRRRMQADQAEAPVACKEKNPFLDDDFGDMALATEAPADVDDPYTSSSWKVEQENNERTLKTTRMTSNHQKDKAEDFNPYDTGVFKEKDWRD